MERLDLQVRQVWLENRVFLVLEVEMVDQEHLDLRVSKETREISVYLDLLVHLALMESTEKEDHQDLKEMMVRLANKEGLVQEVHQELRGLRVIQEPLDSLDRLENKDLLVSRETRVVLEWMARKVTEVFKETLDLLASPDFKVLQENLAMSDLRVNKAMLDHQASREMKDLTGHLACQEHQETKEHQALRVLLVSSVIPVLLET